MEGVNELAALKQLARLLFFLPFEINKKVSLNLQVSEQFQLSYFDPQHTEVERRQDSAFGERDTGIKLTIFYVLSARQTTGVI